jgi:hypothetical protein
MLPKSKIPTKLVDFDGEKVTVKGLTRNQVKRMTDVANNAPEACDAITISMSTGESEADVEAWLETASFNDSQKLIEAILELSGLGDSPKDSNENSSSDSETPSSSS